MAFRQYLDVLRRRVWFIAQAVLIVAIATGVVSSLRPPAYEATARILLRPDDPAEQLNPVRPAYRDAARYVQAQKDIITSEAVAHEAAATLNGITAGEIARQLSVRNGAQSDVLKISARDADPLRARDIANAVAKGYIENRRRSAVAGLERAARELEDKLAPLQARIAELDLKIAATNGGGTTAPESPTRPVTAPASPATPPQSELTAGGLPTTSEALKATRYAAAVQYETLYSRQQELLVDISLKRGEAELIAEAKTPAAPISPRPARDAAAGAFVGVLLGIGVALLREQLDDRLHSTAEIEKITGLPVLAELPYDKESAEEAPDVAAIARPQSSLSETVRALRTSIHYLGVDRPVKVIVVTSAVPGEGKSLVSANLAAVYAQAGHRTVLLAADLRRNGVTRLFGMGPSAPGLTDVIARTSGNGFPAPRSDNGSLNGRAVHATVTAALTPPATPLKMVSALAAQPTPNLNVVPSGPTPPNPAELLGSSRMQQLLSDLAEHNDVIVIDTPPLLPVTDAAVLAAMADGVVLVTALGETRRDAVRRAKGILDGTQIRVLGTVVNKSPASSSAYYYGGYYGPDGNGSEVPAPNERRRHKRPDGRRRRRPPVLHDTTADVTEPVRRPGRGRDRPAR